MGILIFFSTLLNVFGISASADLIQGTVCPKVLKSFTPNEQKFSTLVDEAYRSKNLDNMSVDDLSRRLFEAAKVVFAESKTNVTVMDEQAFMILPEPTGSWLNRLAAGLQKEDEQLMYFSRGLVQDQGMGAFFNDSILTLPHEAVLGLGVYDLKTAYAYGATLHEARHGYFAFLLKKGVDSLFHGWFKSIDGKRPISDIAKSLYNFNMSLDELSTFPLHLRIWASAIDTLPPEQQAKFLDEYEKHIWIAKSLHRQVMKLLAPKGTVRSVDNVSITDLNPLMKRVVARLGNISIEYDFSNSVANVANFNARSKALVDLSTRSAADLPIVSRDGQESEGRAESGKSD